MDNSSNIGLYSAGELAALVGNRARERRLADGRRQIDLARAAGVPVSTLKRFEHGEHVGLDVAVRVAMALDAQREFAALFPPLEPRTLDEVLRAKRKRVRARKAR